MQTFATARSAFRGSGWIAFAFLTIASPSFVLAQNVGDPNLKIYREANTFYDRGNFFSGPLIRK